MWEKGYETSGPFGRAILKAFTCAQLIWKLTWTPGLLRLYGGFIRWYHWPVLICSVLSLLLGRWAESSSTVIWSNPVSSHLSKRCCCHPGDPKGPRSYVSPVNYRGLRNCVSGNEIREQVLERSLLVPWLLRKLYEFWSCMSGTEWRPSNRFMVLLVYTIILCYISAMWWTTVTVM